MVHSFAKVASARLPRSIMDRSSSLKTTFNAGYLVPFWWDEVLPGDTFNVHAKIFGRLSTPIVPVLDNLYLETFFFFVPNRLLWENWERFQGAQDNPDDSIDFTIPRTDPATAVTGFVADSLYDYFGLPTEVPGIQPDALYLRAYNLIWNEWFRDQNLQDSVTVLTDNGPDPIATYALLRRGRRHDYFTSALPWPQKGPAVPLPLGDVAPVVGIGKVNQTWAGSATNVYETGGTGSVSYAVNDNAIIDPGTTSTSFRVKEDPDNAGFPAIYTDLARATGNTVNLVREALTIQHILERDARTGTRYVEILLGRFGVVAPDFRLQRPEYLGGGRAQITFHPVAQTSQSPAAPGPTDTPQGNTAAFAQVGAAGHGFVKGFVEHGVCVGLVCVRADQSYQQGLDREWSRSTRYDFYMPETAHLGEQAVLNQEIYCVGSANPTQDADVFGYQERWAEYRYKNSKVTGRMRSNYAQSLDVWHLVQNYSSLPVLGPTFIVENPPVDRLIAVADEPHLIMDSFVMNRAARIIPTYSTPGLSRF